MMAALAMVMSDFVIVGQCAAVKKSGSYENLVGGVKKTLVLSGFPMYQNAFLSSRRKTQSGGFF